MRQQGLSGYEFVRVERAVSDATIRFRQAGGTVVQTREPSFNVMGWSAAALRGLACDALGIAEDESTAIDVIDV